MFFSKKRLPLEEALAALAAIAALAQVQEGRSGQRDVLDRLHPVVVHAVCKRPTGRADLREDFKEVLTDLFCVIAVGLADEPDGIRQQDVTLRFLRFVFLPLFVFLICDLLHGGYLSMLE